MSHPYEGLGTGPDTRGWTLWVSSVVMVVLAGLFVAARIAQRVLRDNLGADDWTIIAALLASVVLSVTEIEAVDHGYGARYKTLTAAQATEARKWFYGAQIAYKVVLALVKVAICWTIYRIFKISSRRFRWTCYVLLGFIIVSSGVFILGTIFQCNPIYGFWDKTAKASCFNNVPWWLSYAALQILLDIVLLLLAVSEVLKLKMSTFDKLGLILVFSTGLFVTATSIYRATTLIPSATNSDPTYGPTPATTWAVIEANSGIIAACLPLLRQPVLSCLRWTSQLLHVKTLQSGELSKEAQMRQLSDSQLEGGSTPSVPRESLEIVKKSDIYVLSDVQVTSTPRGPLDDIAGHQRPFD